MSHPGTTDSSPSLDLPATPLRIAVIGGGPGGLFSAIALAQRVPDSVVDVFERNKESDVFGFGVVFSDATLDYIDKVDTVLRDTLTDHGRHWDAIEVRAKGQTVRAGGNGMSAVHRRVLLGALQSRAGALGANMHYSNFVDAQSLDASGKYDLVVVADGTNSASREHFSDRLHHSVEDAAVKFIWFGTTFQFDGLTFLHTESEHGNFAVHAYPIGSDLSTFIVETDEDTWRRAGLDGFDSSSPPGVSDTVSQKYLETLFADQIDGHKLVANNSRWSNFRTRRTEHWHTRAEHGTPVVFIGDAMHTAHFSVGSGTKMAMEDAAALAHSIAAHSDLDIALTEFENTRKPQVAKIQTSSVPSLSWWDHFGEYYRSFEPWQFGFHFFSRSISAEKIRVRDPEFVATAELAWSKMHESDPLSTPLTLGTRTLDSRLLTVVATADGEIHLSDGTTSITAVSEYGSAEGTLPLITAPDVHGTTLDPATRRFISTIVESNPAAVAVRGGTELSRVLCSELIRLGTSIPSIVVDHRSSVRARRSIDEKDCAATLVLSGRADAVAFEPDPATARRVPTDTEVAR